MQNNIALIVVDIQNGFMPGGNLAVAEADHLIPRINQLAQSFENVILTQDWHPDNHISFAENHWGHHAFDTIEVDYGPQVLWPTHCVQGTYDADFPSSLNIPHAQLIIRKGFHTHIDSYSAFFEADRTTSTGLAAYLQARGISIVFIVGVATDFCVAWTALDACRLGFKTYVVEDACQGIDLNGSLDKAWQDMHDAGVIRVHAQAIFEDL